jgi:hypothetical protein
MLLVTHFSVDRRLNIYQDYGMFAGMNVRVSRRNSMTMTRKNVFGLRPMDAEFKEVHMTHQQKKLISCTVDFQMMGL